MLANGGYTDVRDVTSAVQRGLRGAVDWDGLRTRPAAVTVANVSAQVAPLPVDNVDWDGLRTIQAAVTVPNVSAQVSPLPVDKMQSGSSKITSWLKTSPFIVSSTKSISASQFSNSEEIAVPQFSQIVLGGESRGKSADEPCEKSGDDQLSTVMVHVKDVAEENDCSHPVDSIDSQAAADDIISGSEMTDDDTSPKFISVKPKTQHIFKVACSDSSSSEQSESSDSSSE